jgi:hypothetical protein
MATQKLKYIRRTEIASHRTFGWMVRVTRKKQNYDRLFSDSLYGGKRKSLAEAIAYRDSILALHGDTEGYKLWRRSAIRQNNTSGITGVGRYAVADNRPGKNGRLRTFWQAYWSDAEGRRHSKKFSVGLYGEEKARTLAIRERRKQMRLLFGRAG